MEYVTSSNQFEFVERGSKRTPAHFFAVAHHIAVSCRDPENRSKELQHTQE